MLKVENDCTACGSCVQACPKGCLSLQCSEQGFVIPKVDAAECIDCNICVKVCHLNAASETEKVQQRAYAVLHLSRDVRDRSTSGGAFTAIAKYVLLRDGVVYGCAYEEHLKARHICVENERDLERLNGSKYVESEIGDTYRRAREQLKNGQLVLFSGTPCQIAGLKAFLQKPYDNLITVDIVCHGVAPQKLFSQYIDWFEKKHDLHLTDYSFRSKQNGGWSCAGVAHGTSNRTGKRVSKKLFYFNEYYYYHFLKGTIYRESCYACRYANMNRQGDFTLGDLWGAEGLELGFSVDDGCSLVLANSQRANEILNSLEIYKTEIPLEVAAKFNMQLHCASAKPQNREQALEMFASRSPAEIDAWFRKSAVRGRAIGKIKSLVPQKVKKALLKRRYKSKF